MKITSLHHVAYAVENYKRVRKFWKQLGFTLLQQPGQEETAPSVFWIGQVQIQLHPTISCPMAAQWLVGSEMCIRDSPMAAQWRENHTRDDLYQICL